MPIRNLLLALALLLTSAFAQTLPPNQVYLGPLTDASKCVPAPAMLVSLCFTLDHRVMISFEGSTLAAIGPGATGPQGIPGKDGANGVNGSNGKDGLNGKDGVNGTNGRDGTSGLNGKDGLDGKDGAPGPQGMPGTFPTSFTLTCVTGLGNPTHSSKCTISVP